MRFKYLLSMVIFWGFIFCFLPYVATQLNNYLSFRIFDYTAFKLIGLILGVLGISIIAYCTSLFFKVGHGTPAPFYPTKRFVAIGPYRFVRNPMYIGYFLVFLSEFLIFGHILILFYLLAMLFIINLFIIFYEEKSLKKRFGKSYVEYTRKVNRWLPTFNS